MRVLVATAMWPTPEHPEFGSWVRSQVDALRAHGVEIELMVLEGRWRKLIYPKGMVQLRARLAAKPVDLIHAHYSYVGAVARTQRSVPIVVTYHGDDVLGTPDADGRYSRWSKVIAAGGLLLGNHVDAVIVQNEEMRRRFKRDDVHVIPHEVELELFKPVDRLQARAELGLDPDRPYILFACSPHVPRKNYPLAKAALEIVRRTLPETEMAVLYKDPQQRLALYMSACDVLAFPSYMEGSPVLIKQAMACNLPIVASDAGDIPKLIGGTDGCHVAERDPEIFASLLLGELTRRRRTDGRTAMAYLAPERVAARIAAVYEDTLAGRDARSRSASSAPAAAG
jgi:teichuronic acid biosynthesis glycosyltransferase TuaC